MLAFYPLFRLIWTLPQGVDLNRASFSWIASVVDMTHAAPTAYVVEAGVTRGGPYPWTKSLTGSPLPTTIPVNQVVSTVGTYYSVVTAVNQFGQSTSSNEVKFLVGYSPQFPSGYSIVIV